MSDLKRREGEKIHDYAERLTDEISKYKSMRSFGVIRSRTLYIELLTTAPSYEEDKMDITIRFPEFRISDIHSEYKLEVTMKPLLFIY